MACVVGGRRPFQRAGRAPGRCVWGRWWRLCSLGVGRRRGPPPRPKSSIDLGGENGVRLHPTAAERVVIEPAGGMVVAIGVVGRCLPRLATWLTQYDDRLLRHGWQVWYLP